MNPRTKVEFPWTYLERPLEARTRRALDADLRALLQFQRTLQGFPPLRATAIDATPFVSLYARGVLRGSFGSADAVPKQRLARAFLRAMHDDHRFGPIADDDRRALTAQVSYLRTPRRIDDVAELEPGVQGIAVVHPSARTLILPSVTRMRGLDGARLLDSLALKGKLDRASLAEATLFAFETDDVIVHHEQVNDLDPLEGAARWLARLIDGSGHVAYAVDAAKQVTQFVGDFHHGRSAIVLRALAQHGGHRRAVERGRLRMQHDVERSVRGAGEAVEGWPRDPARVASTIALAVLAGVDTRPVLRSVIADGATLDALLAAPWQAAQVVTALGTDAPASLFRACVADLTQRPWAPWTALAARALGDEATLARVRLALSSSVRADAPMRGGVSGEGKSLAETALTAIVVEALPDDEAAPRAREFLRRMQLLPARTPAHLSLALSSGAFAASPVSDVLRGDVTAHALLALLPRR